MTINMTPSVSKSITSALKNFSQATVTEKPSEAEEEEKIEQIQPITN